MTLPPMSLQERLRDASLVHPVIPEAAAELDRLQARVAELEAALAAIAEGCSFPADDVQRAVRDRARAAIDTARKAKP